MKKSLLTFLVCVFCLSAFSQKYSNSIGLRGGLNNGITFKTFISSGKALEITGDFVGNFELSAIYQIQKTGALGTSELDWYYGVGPIIGFYSNARYGRDFDDPGDADAIGFGAIGMIGLEYAFNEIPIVISGDVGLGINAAPFGYVYPHAGLGLRYYW